MNNLLEIHTLRQLSYPLGFAAAGITPIPGLIPAKYQWAKTALCFALAYPKRIESNQVLPSIGVVSSFAAGPDYHTVFKSKLMELVSDLTLNFPFKFSVHVDDALLPERTLAYKAAIGWIGKNNLLHVPDYGSYVVLGEILTDMECTDESSPLPSSCKNCNLCISACTTSALQPDGTFIRSRCISNITQRRGSLSNDQMAAMGNCLYGCDRCQQVCPDNDLQDVSIDPQMAVTTFPGACPPLLDVINISQYEWNSTAHASSVGWIGRSTWRRNGIIAAANSRYLPAVESINAALTDPSPTIVTTSKWAVARMFVN